MQILKRSSPGARAALIYITVGALLMVWTGIWYVYLNNNPPRTTTVYYICTGLLVTGFILLVIGLAVGRIGQAAREADQLPATVPESTVVAPAPPQPANGAVAAVPVGSPDNAITAPAPASPAPSASTRVGH
jgi:hypothetical protein